MAILGAFDNRPVMSNISDVAGFKIKTSNVAFDILSSGLYANKIRAVIRELSCNAVDSHIAAGKSNTPFLVRLPNHLNPTFSIRDYGIGLTDSEVRNIFTVYFESTKSNSNDYIGALGLGSKSPLSYTTNFVVIAIKNKVKNTYSVFISDEGVPAIALLQTELSDEETGVEITFAVKEGDFPKFLEESIYVYTHFSLRPTVTGNSHFNVPEITYIHKNIIDGVHQTKNKKSYAVMGNISYPISIPQGKTDLGDLYYLSDCGLEIRFEIGELDFQASREGLSYTKKTIDAIKNKFQAINDALYQFFEKSLSDIDNYWSKASYIISMHNLALWKPTIANYIDNNNAKSYLEYHKYAVNWNSVAYKTIFVDENAIGEKYNIKLREYHFSFSKCKLVAKRFVSFNVDGYRVNLCENNTFFVINDIQKGFYERVKHHYRNSNDISVFCLNARDESFAMDLDGFFKDIMNPPSGNISNASELDELEKKVKKKATTTTNSIVKLEYDNYRVRHSNGFNLSVQDPNRKYYYVHLNGYNLEGMPYNNVEGLLRDLSSNFKIFNISCIYGVRKGERSNVEKLPNWINLDDYIKQKLNEVKKEDLEKLFLIKEVAIPKYLDFYNDDIAAKVNPNSPFVLLCKKFKRGSDITTDLKNILVKYSLYNINKNMVREMIALKDEVSDRYKMLNYINVYASDKDDAIIEYINQVDQLKGV